MSEQPYFTIYGEDWNYESNTNGIWVARESFDTLSQRLQEAERLLGDSRYAIQIAASCQIGAAARCRCNRYVIEQIDAFLAGKGCKP